MVIPFMFYRNVVVYSIPINKVQRGGRTLVSTQSARSPNVIKLIVARVEANRGGFGSLELNIKLVSHARFGYSEG